MNYTQEQATGKGCGDGEPVVQSNLEPLSKLVMDPDSEPEEIAEDKAGRDAGNERTISDTCLTHSYSSFCSCFQRCLEPFSSLRLLLHNEG